MDYTVVLLSGTFILALYTLYVTHLKGPDIKLIITQESQHGEQKKFKFGFRHIGLNTHGVGLPFDAVFVNEGSRTGTLLPFFSKPLIIKIMPNGIDSNEVKYFAPSLSVSFPYELTPKFPKALGVGENLPIHFEFYINAGAENIHTVINEYDFFVVNIRYNVTTRNDIKIKDKEIKIIMEGGELT